MWKILSSREIFRHPRLMLIEDIVLLPDGTKTDYLKFKYTANAASVIAKGGDGKILIGKEYSHPVGEWLYQFCGGEVPLGEEIEIGANRELMEEAKLRAGKLELLGSYLINNRRSQSKMYVFLATELEEKFLEGDKEEDIELFWKSEDEIDGMIRSGEVANCHFLASWTMYKAHYKNEDKIKG
jgi:8-oxo-dGTP pyrophosphatase MutT (NUDIX family)